MTNGKTKGSVRVANASAAALVFLLTFSGAAHSTAVTAFSGRAIGLSVTVTTPPISTTLTFADTGVLPPQGGEKDATVLTVDTQQAKADVLLSVTMGFDHTAKSEAAVADVTLLPGTSNQVTAVFVRSEAVATCSGVSGSSELVNLVVAGKTVNVSGQPNQAYSVPGVLTLVINEQTSSSAGGTNSITVNALDLKVDGIQVIVSSAHSDITCVTPPPPISKDFMTGGGFILKSDGSHANFGFVAGFKPGQTTPSGHLTYLDHETGMKVKGTVTSYCASGDSCNTNTRTFRGTAEINGISGYTFLVTASDNGEPGKGIDYFSISLSNGYSAAGPLAGGNIQLHT